MRIAFHLEMIDEVTFSDPIIAEHSTSGMGRWASTEDCGSTLQRHIVNFSSTGKVPAVRSHRSKVNVECIRVFR